MSLETFFSKKDIEDIYNTTLMYSILKYKSLPQIWQEVFKERYENALQLITGRNINPHIFQNTNLEELQHRLIEYKNMYNSNIQLNEETVAKVGSNITRLIIYTINKEQNEIDKISYLFDFITSYLSYSEDYNNYCLNIPPIDGFTFDFKENIPIEPSINGTIVMGQGLCEDISNVLQFLGKHLNLQIKVITCNYKRSLHSLNAITLSDGKTYLIDATRLIRKDKSKEECFLVSEQDLNKDNLYDYRKELPITTTYNKPISNYSTQAIELINNINQIRPQVQNLNTNSKNNLR